MAENESLDLNSSNARRWNVVRDAARKDGSCQQVGFLRTFLMQVAGWADIEITGRLPDDVERHLRHTCILRPGESPEAVIALLARNRDKWLAVAAEARRKGLPWAGLLDRNLVRQGAGHAPA